jgi:hypothetical protein
MQCCNSQYTCWGEGCVLICGSEEEMRTFANAACRGKVHSHPLYPFCCGQSWHDQLHLPVPNSSPFANARHKLQAVMTMSFSREVMTLVLATIFWKFLGNFLESDVSATLQSGTSKYTPPPSNTPTNCNSIPLPDHKDLPDLRILSNYTPFILS